MTPERFFVWVLVILSVLVLLSLLFRWPLDPTTAADAQTTPIAHVPTQLFRHANEHDGNQPHNGVTRAFACQIQANALWSGRRVTYLTLESPNQNNVTVKQVQTSAPYGHVSSLTAFRYQIRERAYDQTYTDMIQVRSSAILRFQPGARMTPRKWLVVNRASGFALYEWRQVSTGWAHSATHSCVVLPAVPVNA